MDKSEVSTLKRGSLRMAKHKIQNTEDYLVAMSWMDSKPVHMLSTGVKNTLDYIYDSNMENCKLCLPVLL
jgi:hypothetical protein